MTLAGCGGGNSLARGHAIFTQRCSSCHTLTGHDTHADGGDLALPHLSVADIASFTRVMPLRRPLSRRDTLAVADYVHERASKR
jgi:mono/diheme cytochrome c family protein